MRVVNVHFAERLLNFLSTLYLVSCNRPIWDLAHLCQIDCASAGCCWWSLRLKLLVIQTRYLLDSRKEASIIIPNCFWKRPHKKQTKHERHTAFNYWVDGQFQMTWCLLCSLSNLPGCMILDCFHSRSCHNCGVSAVGGDQSWLMIIYLPMPAVTKFCALEHDGHWLDVVKSGSISQRPHCSTLTSGI